jgi:hypothetical protein
MHIKKNKNKRSSLMVKKQLLWNALYFSGAKGLLIVKPFLIMEL